MIRIRTRLSEESYVFTILSFGKWITMVTKDGLSAESYTANNLIDAGHNHLTAAYKLREKLSPAKNWQERAARDNGFIDDDMGCND